MPFVDHLRELRSRLIKAVIALTIGTVVAWMMFNSIFDLLAKPYNDAIPLLQSKGIKTNRLVMTGIGGSFNFQVKLSLVIGMIISAPIWIWQLWAFILPALHRNERRAVFILSLASTPLFVGGAYLGYLVLPVAIEFLVGFTQEAAESLVSGSDYLTFVLRVIMMFAIGAQIPIVVVLLNRLHVVTAKQLARARPWTIVGIFVFCAIATPTTDPYTFLMLGGPMTALYLAAEGIAWLTDRKRGKAADDFDDLSASPINPPGDIAT